MKNLILFLLLFYSNSLFSKMFIYREISLITNYSYYFYEYSNNNIIYTLSNNNELFSLLMLSNGDIIEFQYISYSNNSKINAFANKDIINIQYYSNNLIITNQIKKENHFFTQSIEASFKFIQSYTNLKEFYFWIINQQNSKPFLMNLKFSKNEKIKINEIIYDAEKWLLTLKGVPSLFFSKEYWFDKNTKIFLLSKGNSGPGTPTIITEFFKQE